MGLLRNKPHIRYLTSDKCTKSMVSSSNSTKRVERVVFPKFQRISQVSDAERASTFIDMKRTFYTILRSTFSKKGFLLGKSWLQGLALLSPSRRRLKIDSKVPRRQRSVRLIKILHQGQLKISASLSSISASQTRQLSMQQNKLSHSNATAPRALDKLPI